MQMSVRVYEDKQLLFSDDFSANRLGAAWTERVKSVGVENGVMFGRQTTTEHGSVASTKLDLPDGNLICECRVQLEHNVTVAFSFDDMQQNQFRVEASRQSFHVSGRAPAPVREIDGEKDSAELKHIRLLFLVNVGFRKPVVGAREPEI